MTSTGVRYVVYNPVDTQYHVFYELEVAQWYCEKCHGSMCRQACYE